MEWVAYAFACAILISLAALTEKKILLTVHSLEFAAGLAWWNFIFSLPFLFFIRLDGVSLVLIVSLFAVTGIGSFSFFLITKCTRHMEISVISPLLSLGPGFAALFAFLLLGEALSLQQVAGIATLIFGAYILEMHPHQRLWDPIKEYMSSRYMHYVLIALCIYGFTGAFDRFILSQSGIAPLTYLVIAHICIAFHFFLFSILWGKGTKTILRGIRQGGLGLVLVSFFTIGYRLMQLEAVKLVSVGLALSIKRTSTFFTTLIGGELFGESNLLRKMMASVILLAGSLLLII